ncbi:MAG: hypothetical protein COX57_07280 [Alphaproteobacteria bacterium CG_4_10_14_0_2_um_filter_63_37]|nr:MAG: hypothetical protein COX57_07280 [Alphaproteobacteria bacterium CG_4_10_14_0_2_um_filter_63_37]
MQIDIAQLDACIEELKSLLKDALIATDLWTPDGLSLGGHYGQSPAVALFTRITGELRETLHHSGFPGLSRYYLSDLDHDHIAMVILHGEDIQQGLLLNSKKVNLGVLLAVVVPRALAMVAKARR